MIISHKHEYLFIEIPLTASWAIHHELCQYYDGIPILHKHATYPEFHRSAVAAERNLFVFATVRNPLDAAVSRYFKLATNHKRVFSNPESAPSLVTDYSDHKKYRYIADSDASFQAFFRKYYSRPYSDLVDVSSDRFDYIIRFENLQEDFARVLEIVGLEQVRPLPVINKTKGREARWESYYTSDTIDQAKRVFGPFMRKWKYDFPSDWGDYQSHRFDGLEYRVLGFLRMVYLTRFRYSRTWFAKFVRLLRSSLSS